jgi:hypothetical protein
MKATRAVAAVVLASLLIGLVPGLARADQAPGGIRASIDHAVARLDPQPSVKKATDRQVSHAAQAAYGGGGGGGKGMLIVTLVTTVVGLGATYYMIKEMQKQTSESQGK